MNKRHVIIYTEKKINLIHFSAHNENIIKSRILKHDASESDHNKPLLVAMAIKG